MHSWLWLGVVAASAAASATGCLWGDGDDPPVIPGDAPPPCALQTTAYVVDAIEVPQTASESAQLGFDLDLDGRVDNAAGALLTTLMALREPAAADLDDSIADALASGRLIWVIAIEDCADGSADYVRVTSFPATDVDDDGVLERADSAAVAAVGAVRANRITAYDGGAQLPVSALADFGRTGAPVAWVRGHGFAVDLTIAFEGDVSGRLGIGLLHQPTLAAIATPLAAYYTQRLAEDDSEWAEQMDAAGNGDGVVSVDELLADDLFVAFTREDVDLLARHEGALVYWPGHDDVDDSLSVGIGFHASPVELE